MFTKANNGQKFMFIDGITTNNIIFGSFLVHFRTLLLKRKNNNRAVTAFFIPLSASSFFLALDLKFSRPRDLFL